MKVRFRVADDRYRVGEIVDVPAKVARCLMDEGRVDVLSEPEPVVVVQDRALQAPAVDRVVRSRARPIAPR